MKVMHQAVKMAQTAEVQVMKGIISAEVGHSFCANYLPVPEAEDGEKPVAGDRNAPGNKDNVKNRADIDLTATAQHAHKRHLAPPVGIVA